jgi:hypothetical protein
VDSDKTKWPFKFSTTIWDLGFTVLPRSLHITFIILIRMMLSTYPAMVVIYYNTIMWTSKNKSKESQMWFHVSWVEYIIKYTSKRRWRLWGMGGIYMNGIFPKVKVMLSTYIFIFLYTGKILRVFFSGL